jgi:L-2-hydroxyglutarate oxidase LhgO
LIGGNAARALEPELSCIAALVSPETGIIDGHAFMLALQGDLENHGGVIAFETPVEQLTPKDGGWEIRFGGREPGSMSADAVVNSAGLYAQALARKTGGYPQQRIPPLVLAKGNLLQLCGPAGFFAADLSDAGRWWPRRACHARSRRSYALRS